MDLDGSKRVCGSCLNWNGQRQIMDGMVQVKPTSKGLCLLHKKVKPAHGGCDQWAKVDTAATDV
jgi:hypothetical protein